jgi:AP-1-like transcription factor
VKELEAKLNDLEEASSSLHDENERLKRELAKVATENQILRATSSSAPSSGSMRKGSHPTRHDDEIMKTGPMKYTPTDFLATFRVHHSEDNASAHIIAETSNPNRDSSSSSSHSSSTNPHIIQHHLPAPLITSQGSFTPSAHRISISPLTGQRLLSSGATWDHIQSHPLFQRGLVDIAAVSERLKGTAECDGTGPAFEESRINSAIEESAALPRDELI